MAKLLITSGCSFSECISEHIDTWPRHLAKKLKPYHYEHISCAMGSQGNGLISRGIIYNVLKALGKYKPEDILVGVMWSGSNRHDFRYENIKDLQFVQDKVHNGWIDNPTGFVQGTGKKWVILNVHWQSDNNKEAELYYRHFHDEIGSAIYSFEHILRTQWLLEKYKIPYFFTNYIDENICSKQLEKEPEISYLLKQINFDNYLPCSSIYTWLRSNHILDELWFYENALWEHPKTQHHLAFVRQVIIPYLKSKKIVDCND